MWYALVTYHDKNCKAEIQCRENLEDIGGKGWASISTKHEDPQELIEKMEINLIPCRICGNIYKTNYYNKKQLIERNCCFACSFWLDYVERKDDPRICRIEGNHYCIAPESNDPYVFKGFGGRKWRILKNGREIVTTNLWYQGEIPSYFREELPDNATFIPAD